MPTLFDEVVSAIGLDNATRLLAKISIHSPQRFPTLVGNHEAHYLKNIVNKLFLEGKTVQEISNLTSLSLETVIDVIEETVS